MLCFVSVFFIFFLVKPGSVVCQFLLQICYKFFSVWNSFFWQNCYIFIYCLKIIFFAKLFHFLPLLFEIHFFGKTIAFFLYCLKLIFFAKLIHFFLYCFEWICLQSITVHFSIYSFKFIFYAYCNYYNFSLDCLKFVVSKCLCESVTFSLWIFVI